MRNKKDTPTSADELKNAYDLFIEVMENPERMDFIVKLNKVKPMSRRMINWRLFDRLNYYNFKIKDITEEMLNDIGFK